MDNFDRFLLEEIDDADDAPAQAGPDDGEEPMLDPEFDEVWE